MRAATVLAAVAAFWVQPAAAAVNIVNGSYSGVLDFGRAYLQDSSLNTLQTIDLTGLAINVSIAGQSEPVEQAKVSFSIPNAPLPYLQGFAVEALDSRKPALIWQQGNTVYFGPLLIDGSGNSVEADLSGLRNFETLQSLGGFMVAIENVSGQSFAFVRYNLQFDLTGEGRVVGTDVPEPATWVLMIVGIGMAGAVMRQRQRHAVSYNFC